MSRWGKPKKNVKRIDPRYFLDETTHRDQLDEIWPFSSKEKAPARTAAPATWAQQAQAEYDAARDPWDSDVAPISHKSEEGRDPWELLAEKGYTAEMIGALKHISNAESAIRGSAKCDNLQKTVEVWPTARNALELYFNDEFPSDFPSTAPRYSDFQGGGPMARPLADFMYKIGMDIKYSPTLPESLTGMADDKGPNNFLKEMQDDCAPDYNA